MMTSRSRRARAGAEIRALLAFALPLMLAQLAQMGMGFADALMVARVGALELAAVATGLALWHPLFLTVTGLTVQDFHLLVRLKVFNTEQMNQAVFAFRRYEDASLSYTGIESHAGLSRYGLYDTVVAREAA